MTEVQKAAGKMGVFTLSLDCEGLWGMADNAAVMTQGVISGTALADVYAFILETLDQSGIIATTAFVSGFAAPPDLLRDRMLEIEALAALHPDWFEHLLPRLRSGGAKAMDGLEGHDFWRRFAASGHEMAYHGGTHLALDDSIRPEALDLEMTFSKEIWRALGHAPETIIFPRNRVGSWQVLSHSGLRNYRASPGHGAVARVGGLAREWNILDRGSAARPYIRDGWGVSPSGFFLNWPQGARKVIPIGVTRALALDASDRR